MVVFTARRCMELFWINEFLSHLFSDVYL
jgi:hypothetical protein